MSRISLLILILITPVFGSDFTRWNDNQIKALRSGKHAVVINFWATWCQPCRNEIPALNRLQKKYRDVEFIGINVDDRENRGAIRGFLKKYPIEYTIVLRDGKNFEDLAASFDSDWKAGLPATFVYMEGKQIYGKVGEIAEDALNATLEKIQ